MTTLYLDCEFNGHYGKFISMALYNPSAAQQFYAVSWDWQSYLNTGLLHPFVVEHVLPNLTTPGQSEEQIIANLTGYLNSFDDEVIIIADWPEDFVHLCNLLFRPGLNGNPPSKIIPKLTMQMITTPDIHKSTKPHNAMADAEALYKNHMEVLK